MDHNIMYHMFEPLHDLGLDEMYGENFKEGPKVMSGCRRSGKTTMTIAWMKQNPEATVFVISKSAGQPYIDAGIHPNRVRTHSDLIHGSQGNSKPIAIDDLDRFFISLIGRGIDFATMTSSSAIVAQYDNPKNEDLEW